MDQLTALRVFVRVAEGGSFSRAAELLGMSKSAVSKHVAALESHLGARLLYRTTRQVSLTEEGRAYLERAVRILEDIEEADSAVSTLRAEPRGTLRLNCALSFTIRHIAPALPEFIGRYPKLAVDLELNDRFVDLVEEGYDLAVRIGELEDSALIARRLADVPVLFVAAPDYLRRCGTPSQPTDLAEHACLLYRGRASGREWTVGTGETAQRVKVSGPLVANNGEAIKSAAVGGLGIARLPAFILDDEIARGTLVEVLPAFRPAPIPVQAVYAPNRHLSAKVRAFIDFFAARFAAPGYFESRHDRLLSESA
ncbi:MAG: LysR family transcriptional regulator [Alphaproteobacteria bacterium]|nr:MAG: LysR family transcriptional regulator [Alphaproteobacteria bacterium]